MRDEKKQIVETPENLVAHLLGSVNDQITQLDGSGLFTYFSNIKSRQVMAVVRTFGLLSFGIIKAVRALNEGLHSVSETCLVLHKRLEALELAQTNVQIARAKKPGGVN